MLTAIQVILFFSLNFVFSTNFSLHLYSFEKRSFLSYSFNNDLFPECLNTYTCFHQSPSQLTHLVVTIPSILTIIPLFSTSMPHTCYYYYYHHHYHYHDDVQVTQYMCTCLLYWIGKSTTVGRVLPVP